MHALVAHAVAMALALTVAGTSSMVRGLVFTGNDSGTYQTSWCGGNGSDCVYNARTHGNRTLYSIEEEVRVTVGYDLWSSKYEYPRDGCVRASGPATDVTTVSVTFRGIKVTVVLPRPVSSIVAYAAAVSTYSVVFMFYIGVREFEEPALSLEAVTDCALSLYTSVECVESNKRRSVAACIESMWSSARVRYINMITRDEDAVFFDGDYKDPLIVFRTCS